MRKMIIEMDPARFIQMTGTKIFDVVQSIELIELLKLDLEKGVKIALMEVGLKEGYTLKDLERVENLEYMGVMDILGVLREEGNKYMLITKRVVPDGMKSMARDFDLELVWTTPTIFADDRLVLSVIGKGADLRKLLKLLERIGDITKVSYQQAVIHDHNLMMVLTDKQRDVVIAAKKHGYYDYPRKIKSEELAAKVGISKATVVEHLRKAENRLMTHIMAAY